MFTYAICSIDGAIVSIGRCGYLPDMKDREMNTPEGGIFLDLTGQEDFDSMEILEIHENYKADIQKKKLVKKEQ